MSGPDCGWVGCLADAPDLRPPTTLPGLAAYRRIAERLGLTVTSTPTKENRMAHPNPYRDQRNTAVAHGYVSDAGESRPPADVRLRFDDIDRMLGERHAQGRAEGSIDTMHREQARFEHIYDEGYFAGAIAGREAVRDELAERLHCLLEVVQAVEDPKGEALRTDALRTTAESLDMILTELYKGEPNPHGRPGTPPTRSMGRQASALLDSVGVRSKLEDAPAEITRDDYVAERLEWLRRWLPEPERDPIAGMLDAQDVVAYLRENAKNDVSEVAEALEGIADTIAKGDLPATS